MSEESPQKPWLERLRIFGLDNADEVLKAFGAISLAFGGGYAGIVPWLGVLLLVLGAACLIVGTVVDRRMKGPAVATLTNKLDRAELDLGATKAALADAEDQLQTAWDVLLRDLADSLHLYNTATRLTVYQHGEGRFNLVSRVSGHNGYASRSRNSYPDTQGFIGQVWSGAASGDKVSLPAKLEDRIKLHVETYGIPEEQAKKLRMPTRAMIGVRLQTDIQADPFGVLCVESTTPQTHVKASTKADLEASPKFLCLQQALQRVLAKGGAQLLRPDPLVQRQLTAD